DRGLGKGHTARGAASDIASRLTGARSHSELREALALLRERGGTVAETLARYRRAALLLARPASRRDARAANLLGVVSAAEATAVKEHAAESLASARDEFVASIRDDPAGEDAKHNLELLLAEQTERRRQQSKQGAGAIRKGTGHAPPGSGY